MKRSKFNEERIIGVLKEHQAGLRAKEPCRKYGVSNATFYKSRAKFGGSDAIAEMRCLAMRFNGILHGKRSAPLDA